MSMDRPEILARLGELEHRARGLLDGLAELRAVVEGQRPTLPSAEREELPNGARAGVATPQPEELPRGREPHVEGELADEEGPEATVAGPAPRLGELAAYAGGVRRLRLAVTHRLRPFAVLYAAFVVAVAALIASTAWPDDTGAVVLGLIAALLLAALTALPGVHQLIWREERREEQAALPARSAEGRSKQRPWPRRPLTLLGAAVLVMLVAFLVPVDGVRLALFALVSLIALVALFLIVGDWTREIRARRKG